MKPKWGSGFLEYKSQFSPFESPGECASELAGLGGGLSFPVVGQGMKLITV